MTEPVIRLERQLPHPPAAVWAALTKPDLLARWWAAGDIAPTVGHRFTLDMGAWGQQQCEVLEAVPESRLSYLFAEGSLDTTVTWELEPHDGGTLLRLEHSGFKLDTPLGRQAFEGMGSGWPGVLASLEKALAEETP